MTLYEPTEVSVFVTPGDSAPAKEFPPEAVTPSIVIVKSPADAVPPCVFWTCFTTVNVAGWSLFVSVQVLDSPSAIVPEQSAEALSCV